MAQIDYDKEPRPFTIPMERKEIPCNRTGRGPVRLLFTHGAGGTITSEGIVSFSTGFSNNGLASVVCFQGNMNLKSRVKMFDAVHDNTIQKHRHETSVALGGRSMGARAAVLAAMEDTKCLILASYPLQTDKEVRDQILLDLPAGKDVLFISGDHDSMCDLDRLHEVRQKMKAKTWLIRVRDADHGINVKPKKATIAVGEECGMMAAEWLHTREEDKTEREVWWGEDDHGKEDVRSSTWEEAAEQKSEEHTEGGSGEEDPIASEKIGSTEEALETPNKTKHIPARTKNVDNTTKGLKDEHEALTESIAEPRRSKRRKMGR